MNPGIGEILWRDIQDEALYRSRWVKSVSLDKDVLHSDSLAIIAILSPTLPGSESRFTRARSSYANPRSLFTS